MKLVRWNPMQAMESMERDMDRFFSPFYDDEENFLHAWQPRVDVKESDNEILIEAELPGLKKEDIKLSIKNNTLEISGEKHRQETKKKANWHRSERFYGSFCRSFQLPSSLEEDKIQAVFKDGILNITLPKTEKAKTKEIKILTS